jgi:hypothetical protein
MPSFYISSKKSSKKSTAFLVTDVVVAFLAEKRAFMFLKIKLIG